MTMTQLDSRVARLKERLLSAPYEICLARALAFTRSYKETSGLDPSLRNAMALAATLETQGIRLDPDERIVGSKTEKLLAGPLSVERGDFLRALQLEMEILHLKRRPFIVSDEDKDLFYDEILPYWDGRTVRDFKAAEWEAMGLIDTSPKPLKAAKEVVDAAAFVRGLGIKGARKLLGANLGGPLTRHRIRNIHALRHEWARNNPTPAVFCFDVQGHLSLGVDKVVARGMEAIIGDARERLQRLTDEEERHDEKRAFLEAVILSLEAAIAYSERYARRAEELMELGPDEQERRRLQEIADRCRQVPRNRPRTFHEALQAVWMTLVVGEIQYGTHDVFAVGRPDQYLNPFLTADLASGRLDENRAKALLQELFLKLGANVEPIPELGMESNGTLGNSQHVVTIGGVDREGRDATNELTWLALDAFEEMNGAVNQLALRVSPNSCEALLRRTARTLRRTSGLALFNDDAVIEGLVSDGLSAGDARDYCIVGCVETSGQSNTHGCPGGHELVLPTALWLTLSRGTRPAALGGQTAGCDCGDPTRFRSFQQLLAALRQQLAFQIDVLIAATAAKDRAYRDHLPAPYVSALMDDCIERALDITAGGARYDFTSIDVRGLGTLVDSLFSLEHFVFSERELDLGRLVEILGRDFEGQEVLRQRMLHEIPRYGSGNSEADDLGREIVGWIHDLLSERRNVRGGRYRACFYSYGNHVIDGLLLDATPDGRRRGEPISNGVSPSNLVESDAGPTGPLAAAAKLPPAEVSSGLSLNMRFHPRMMSSERGAETFTKLLRTYFSLGGMHLQPNVVSTETLRDAQQRPENYRDLVVKVAGYSAYFTDLGRSIQEDIIARQQFGA